MSMDSDSYLTIRTEATEGSINRCIDTPPNEQAPEPPTTDDPQTFYEPPYDSLRRPKQRYSLTFTNTVLITSSNIYEHGRYGVWTPSQDLVGGLSTRLGCRAFDLGATNDAIVASAASKAKSTLFVRCELGNELGRTFSAVVHVRCPSNTVERYRDVLHRWEIAADTSGTPWLPIGLVGDCLTDWKVGGDDKKVVWLTFEVTVYLEKQADTCITQVVTADRLQKPMVKKMYTVRLYPSKKGVHVDQTKVETHCPFLRTFFEHKSPIYSVNEQEEKAIILILRYIQFQLVPRSDQIDKALLSTLVIFRMTKLQRICMRILHPVRMRAVRFGYQQLFRLLHVPADAYVASMFDMMLPNALFQQPLSMVALSIGCLEVGASEVDFQSDANDQLRAFQYARLVDTTMLLPPDLLSTILNTDRPPTVASTPVEAPLLPHLMASRFSTDGSSEPVAAISKAKAKPRMVKKRKQPASKDARLSKVTHESMCKRCKKLVKLLIKPSVFFYQVETQTMRKIHMHDGAVLRCWLRLKY